MNLRLCLCRFFARRSALLFAPLLIVSASAPAQAQPAAAPASGSSTAASSSTAKGDEKIVTLSPFEVNTSKDQGYAATSTLSGTRMNSKLEDLAASISVVTKQQLLDTAAVDINDIFLYEANTEGMQQYTEFNIDRGFYNETTTQNPQSANRIRGIGAANISLNNYSTTGTIPIDEYTVDSVEISRGPNANIFGLGNAAGTVNLVTSDARTDRDLTQVSVRGDSYGSWRSSANINRVLMKDHLAFRVAYLHDDKASERKPSYDFTNRLFLSAIVRPFSKTTVRAAYESYSNHFSRANTTLPRDGITEWMNSGMPVWDPTFGTSGGWHPLAGSAVTAVTTANESAQLPAGLLPGSLDSGIWTNPAVAIEPNGNVTFYGFGSAANLATNPAPAATPVFRYVQTGSAYRRGVTASGTPLILYQSPSLTDKRFYDWESMNFLSPNYGRDKGDTFRFELEQNFFRTPTQRLDAQVGVYREMIDRYDHSIFSRSDSGVPYLLVDVNQFRLDGSANPNFLRPYLGAGAPSIKYTDEKNTHRRASVAYQLDLTNAEGWKKWFGRNTFNFYGERRDILTTSKGSRDVNITNYSWSSANDLGSLPLRGNTYRIYPRYYVGGPVTDAGPIMDSAPAQGFNLGTTPLTWYTPTRGKVEEAANIQEIIQSGSAKDREIRSKGVIWQGSFWNDRIVPTIGWRDDRNREHSSRNLNANLNATTTIDPNTHIHDLSFLTLFPQTWEEKKGQSRQQGVVVKPLRWLNLNYNQSTSFKPETLAYDINNELLPNPTGKSKDYGFTLKLFNEKLVARFTRYDTEEKNSRNAAITSAAVTRTLRLFFDPSSSNAIIGGVPANPTATLPNGSDAFDLEQAATQWYLWGNPGWTIDQARAAAVTNYLVPLGITAADIDAARTIGSSGFTDVNTVTSTGNEVEITYNPNRFWRMKFTGAQQKAVDTELGNAVNDYINLRLKAVQSIIVPTNSQTTANGTAGLQWWQISPTNPAATGTATPAGFYVANVKSVIGLATANAGKPRAQTREYTANFTTTYQLAGLGTENWLKDASVGGAVRWSSKAALGYFGAAPSTDPAYKGAIVDYDPNRPIYDKPRAAFDFWASYNMRLWNDRIRCKLQLNVKNIFESGRLQPIGYNPDGFAWNYRIVDPRQIILSATFDL
jgi:outer membrane receptor protein involved in Fe transport